jgi:hypothetical protein
MSYPSTFPTVTDAFRTNRLPRESVSSEDINGAFDAINKLEDRVRNGWQFHARDRGAVADCKSVSDAAMTSGSATLTSNSAVWTAADVGKLVTVHGAAAAGGPLVTTISAYVGPTQVTLALAASTTISGRLLQWGTDNTARIQQTLDEAGAFAAGFAIGAVAVFEPGAYMTSAGITRPASVDIMGTGRKSTVIQCTPTQATGLTLSGGTSDTKARHGAVMDVRIDGGGDFTQDGAGVVTWTTVGCPRGIFIKHARFRYGSLIRVTVESCDVAIAADDTGAAAQPQQDYQFWHGVWTRWNRVGCRLLGMPDNSAFVACNFEEATQVNLDIGMSTFPAQGVWFYGCVFNNYSFANPGAVGTRLQRTRAAFYGCWWEQTTDTARCIEAVANASGSVRVSIYDGHMNGNNLTAYAIKIPNDTTTRVAIRVSGLNMTSFTGAWSELTSWTENGNLWTQTGSKKTLVWMGDEGQNERATALIILNKNLRVVAGDVLADQNLGVGGATSFGGGVGVAGLPNATTVPTTNPPSGGLLYSEAEVLKWRDKNGTVWPVSKPSFVSSAKWGVD